ncbi:hypothetical protein TNIN_207621 [Trichonephila inaurata madagascariensis]|uniref:Uncharacterized protein n=1 Tax=Trichonephila inaurata madagascariensis TaxID=2747483 RepID=A0A8X7BZQ8_9ARAC|nr:hypothetical protein TNIN_207621 [Trichonephila inaurata madagascariensis]
MTGKKFNQMLTNGGCGRFEMKGHPGLGLKFSSDTHFFPLSRSLWVKNFFRFERLDWNFYLEFQILLREDMSQTNCFFLDFSMETSLQNKTVTVELALEQRSNIIR